MFTKNRRASLWGAFTLAAALGFGAVADAAESPAKSTSASTVQKSAQKKAAAKPASKPKAAPKKSIKKAAPRITESTNTIFGMPADVSSIILVVEGPNQFRVLSEDEPHARRTPASITKLMTLAILFEELEAGRIKLDDKITMPRSNPGGGQLHIPGRKLSVEDAILAIVVKSANDAALAVAEHISGSEEEFAQRMNQKAIEIGMTNSHFVNAHGMRHPDQFSTAYDLALLSRHLIQEYDQYYHYFSKPSFTYGKRTYKNHNGLMSQYEGMDGLKTGMTFHGWQLAASATRTLPGDAAQGTPPLTHRLIGVFLGGITKEQRNNCLGYLLDQGYITLGHPAGPTTFPYSPVACTSARNKPKP